jgi:hypothetical protein
MTEQLQDPIEQIPNQHIIAELEAQLHAKTSELVVANARIRARDEAIARMKHEYDLLAALGVSD